MLGDWHCATFCQHLGDCHKISVFNSPVNPDKGLTPHTPQRRLRRLLFLCLLPGDPQAKQPGFTFRYKWPKLCYITKEPYPMTDYSTAIFGLIAFTGIVSAAVVYILAQPSDLPVVKKAKAAQS